MHILIISLCNRGMLRISPPYIIVKKGLPFYRLSSTAIYFVVVVVV